MNPEDRIEASLRRRPSDERTYDEPLAALVSGEGVHRVRPTTRSRMRAGALPALAAAALVVAIGAGVLAAGVFRGSTAGPSEGSNDFQLTGRIGCFGQGPGFTPGPQGTSGEGCQLMAVPPAGYTAGTWTLDPAYPYSAGATEIHVLVDEWTCHGSQTAEGLIVKNVGYRPDAVVVTLAIRARQGPQTCPGTPPTPYVVRLDQAVGDRLLQDGGRWPAQTLATGEHPVVTPTPTPYPSSWHQPMDCSSDMDVASFYKMAAMVTSFDVYCPKLPGGWSVVSDNQDQLSGVSSADLVTITYRGPGGETFSLQEGKYCEAKGSTICDRIGPEIGKAMFGDRQGTLGGSNGQYYIFTPPDGEAMWTATSSGMSQDQFTALAASLIIVGK